MKIIVLGGGMVGRVIAADLAASYEVTCADLNETVLKQIHSQYGLKTVRCDFSQPDDIRESVRKYDLVIGAVPGFLGFNMLKTVIESGKNIVDISFFPEDGLQLDKLAKRNGVTAIIDCGIAPGYCNLIAGYYYHRMKTESYSCMVGGLPLHPVPPFYYQAPFSPADVIEEYVRPARLKENGKFVTKEALSEIELIEFPQCGQLEAFNTDGLRSLLTSLPLVNTLKEKTLRFPGHAELMRAFRDSGFFSAEKIETTDGAFKPLSLTSTLLFKQWKYNPGEEDFTIMKVVITGEEKEIIYTIYDRYHLATQTMSMARTTGYTCSAAAQWLIQGKFTEKGIYPPEFMGKDETAFQFVTNYLKRKEIQISITEKMR